MKDCFWSLYNSVDDVRIDGIRTPQLAALLRTLDHRLVSEWLTWQEGTTEWKRASEAIAELKIAVAPPPPSPSTNELTIDPESEEKVAAEHSFLRHEVDETDIIDPSDQPANGAKGTSDGRQNPRFDMKLKVFLSVGAKVLANETVNISVGGMKLAHPLPADLSGIHDVTLVNGPTELGLRCRVLKGAHETEPTRLLIEHCNRMDILREWIHARRN